jgi:hypothetical protein
MFEARMEDRLAIQDVIYRWCRGTDRRDMDLVRSVYHPDGQAYHGPTPRSPDELVAWLGERHASIIQSMHQAANIRIEFTGPDTALAETYMVSYQRIADSDRETRVGMLGEEAAARPGTLQVEGAGRYVDRFERRDGRWAILKRTVIVEGLVPSLVPDHYEPDPTWPPLARRDRDDPSYVEQRAVGLT